MTARSDRRVFSADVRVEKRNIDGIVAGPSAADHDLAQNRKPEAVAAVSAQKDELALGHHVLGETPFVWLECRVERKRRGGQSDLDQVVADPEPRAVRQPDGLVDLDKETTERVDRRELDAVRSVSQIGEMPPRLTPALAVDGCRARPRR